MLIKTGSKLFLSGEYAILKEGYSANILFIKKYMYFEINQSEKISIYSSFYKTIGYFLDDNKDYQKIYMILQEIHKYIEELGISIRKYSINIDSQLDINGNKLGLGSSASLLVGLIKSVLKFHDIHLTKINLFKLAVGISNKVGQKGSKGDIACIVYEQNIIYTKFRDFNFTKYTDLFNNYFELLNIEKLNLNYPYKIHYTKMPSSTDEKIRNFNVNDEKIQDILKDISDTSKKISQNIDFFKNLEKANNLMYQLDDILHLGIVTEYIRNYQKMHKNTKISGAGGGDCILQFFKEKFEY